MRSWTGVLDGLFFSLSPLWRLLIIALLMALMIIVSRRKRFLTWGGCAAAALLGLVVMYISGISGIVLLLFFFLSSSIVSHLSRRLDYIAEKGDERDMMQVAANGIPAALSILLYRISPYPEAFIIAFAAAIAEAEADTFSGEIGRLSHSDPVSILTFTKVPKGLSGGITALGLAAGAASSFLIALLFMGTFGCTLSSLLIIASSGFLGSVFDSLLGASIQVQYRREDGSITEKAEEDGRRNERARGIKWLDNDMVNLLSGLFSVSIAIALSFLG